MYIQKNSSFFLFEKYITNFIDYCILFYNTRKHEQWYKFDFQTLQKKNVNKVNVFVNHFIIFKHYQKKC